MKHYTAYCRKHNTHRGLTVAPDETLEISLDRSSTGAALRDVVRHIERQFGRQARNVEISLVRIDA